MVRSQLAPVASEKIFGRFQLSRIFKSSVSWLESFLIFHAMSHTTLLKEHPNK